MKDQITLILLFFALLVGCNRPIEVRDANLVPEGELSAFLEQAKTGDFHDLERSGRALLKPGLSIPDHETRLKAFPSSSNEAGLIGYELMSFEGDGSAGGINLILKADTGEITQFLPFEATL